MASHPNLVHWDDVAPVTRSLGDMRWSRRRLGRAAGAEGIGLSRFAVEPGARTFPPHVHADEEEFTVVLGGTGLAVHDDTCFEVGAGHVLLHRAGAEAHTLVAGGDGLDVLVFGSGSPTGLTFQPRTRTYWAGPHWIPPAGENPLELDAALGPLDLPEPGPPPATACRLEDLEPEVYDRPGYRGRERNLRTALGSRRSGLRWDELEPGQLSCPPHCHAAEEECFVVLEGSGTAWLDDERHPLRPGHVLLRPPGTRVAHAIEAGPEGITYLAYGTHRPDEIVWYPRSKKVLTSAGVVFRVEPVDYWDGEDRADPGAPGPGAAGG